MVVAVDVFHTDVKLVEVIDGPRPVKLSGMLDEVEREVVGCARIRHWHVELVFILRDAVLPLVGRRYPVRQCKCLAFPAGRSLIVEASVYVEIAVRVGYAAVGVGIYEVAHVAFHCAQSP